MVELDGSDGGRYRVEIYWDDLHVIPGEHRILARIWNSDSEYVDQQFTSGNRLWLKSVSVDEKEGPDYLLLSFKPVMSRWFARQKSIYTVTRTEIIEHFQYGEEGHISARTKGHAKSGAD